MIETQPNIFISAKDITIITDPSSHSVTITHRPTGIVSEYKRYKSEHKNKIEAMLALRDMLYNLRHKKQLKT